MSLVQHHLISKTVHIQSNASPSELHQQRPPAATANSDLHRLPSGVHLPEAFAVLLQVPAESSPEHIPLLQLLEDLLPLVTIRRPVQAELADLVLHLAGLSVPAQPEPARLPV